MSGWTGLWLFPGAILIIPAIVWFVKVQGALNRLLGVEGRDGPLDRAAQVGRPGEHVPPGQLRRA